MKSDPGFTYRDGLYYYLAESLVKVRLDAEALPLYDKLLAEFTESEFLEKARLRQEELKANMAKAGRPGDAAHGRHGHAAHDPGAGPETAAATGRRRRPAEAVTATSYEYEIPPTGATAIP